MTRPAGFLAFLAPPGLLLDCHGIDMRMPSFAANVSMRAREKPFQVQAIVSGLGGVFLRSILPGGSPCFFGHEHEPVDA